MPLARVSTAEMGDTYYGLVAEGYDTYLAQVDFGDLECWRSLLREANGPALELACGTGRLLLPLRAEGHTVEGLDASAEMLAICRAKLAARRLDATLHHAAMENLSLPTRYGAIFCAAGSLSLLTSEAAQRQVLCASLRHLGAGGIAAFAMFDATPPGSPGRRLRREGRRPDGAVHRVWEERLANPTPGVEARRMTHEIVVDGEVVATETGTASWRPLAPAALAAMLAEVGFAEVRVTDRSGTVTAPEDISDYVVVGKSRH